MESEKAVSLVEDLFAFRNLLNTPAEFAVELKLLGLTITDVEANQDLLLEAGIARNIRRACEAMDITITPHQSLTLAKHMRVSADHYRNGVPLSDHERAIALRLTRLYLQGFCRKKGEPFTQEHEKDCERMVRFGERGLTIGHRIGEASGCFKVLLMVSLSTASLIALSALMLTARGENGVQPERRWGTDLGNERRWSPWHSHSVKGQSAEQNAEASRPCE